MCISMAVCDSLPSLGEDLRTLNSDLRLVMSAMGSKTGEGSVACVSSRKQDTRKERNWNIDSLVQTGGSSLKG